jgi:hypothetical protein
MCSPCGVHIDTPSLQQRLTESRLASLSRTGFPGLQKARIEKGGCTERRPMIIAGWSPMASAAR